MKSYSARFLVQIWGKCSRLSARLLFLFNPNVSTEVKYLATTEGARRRWRVFRCKHGMHYWLENCIDRFGYRFDKCLECGKVRSYE